MISHQELLAAYQFRHACKEFNPDKKISETDFHAILETGRLSPSSLGLEPWKFLVIQNMALREKIRKHSWGAQGQLPTASHYVAILTRLAPDLQPTSDYIQQKIMRETQHLPEDAIALRTARIASFAKDDADLVTDRTLEDWASKQSYIAMGNMMTAAALLGIDSCPIEGFNQPKVNDILNEAGLLEDRFHLFCMVAFGYRKADPARPKTRRKAEEVIQWIE